MLQVRRTTIAVVGLSDKPDRDSYRVAAYMQQQGYRIIPVNPAIKEVLGERLLRSLQDIPGKVELVDIFRKPEAVPEIVADAIAAGAQAIWMQEGIAHNQAADQARAAGLQVVMNKCLLKEHRGLYALESEVVAYPRSPSCSNLWFHKSHAVAGVDRAILDHVLNNRTTAPVKTLPPRNRWSGTTERRRQCLGSR